MCVPEYASRSGDVDAAAAAVSAAVTAHRSSGAALIRAVVGNPTLDTVLAPAEPYIAAANFLLEANLLPLAESAVTRAAACLAEQDVPKVCMA